MKALARLADSAERFLDGRLQIVCGVGAVGLMVYAAVMVCIVGPVGGA